MIQLILALTPFFYLAGLDTTVGITVDIEGHHPGKGQFILALFDSAEKFESQENPAYFLTVDNQDNESSRPSLEFNEVITGRYAIAVFQDLNMNGKLDKNWMGIPREPYGFSGEGNFKWRPPSFEEAAFNIDDKAVRMVIQLVEW